MFVDLKDVRPEDQRTPYVFNEDGCDPDLRKFKDHKDQMRFLRADVRVYPDSVDEQIFNEILEDFRSDSSQQPRSTYLESDDNLEALRHFFLDGHEISSWIEDAKDKEGLSITFATNDKGDEWNYQTGDNSFAGAVYSLPHWGVSEFRYDTTPESVAKEVIDAMNEVMPADTDDAEDAGSTFHIMS